VTTKACPRSIPACSIEIAPRRSAGGRIDHAELGFRNGLVLLSATTGDGRDWLGMPVGPANISLVAPDDAAVGPPVDHRDLPAGRPAAGLSAHRLSRPGR
jgi:hypothetical protein